MVGAVGPAEVVEGVGVSSSPPIIMTAAREEEHTTMRPTPATAMAAIVFYYILLFFLLLILFNILFAHPETSSCSFDTYLRSFSLNTPVVDNSCHSCKDIFDSRNSSGVFSRSSKILSSKCSSAALMR